MWLSQFLERDFHICWLINNHPKSDLVENDANLLGVAAGGLDPLHLVDSGEVGEKTTQTKTDQNIMNHTPSVKMMNRGQT